MFVLPKLKKGGEESLNLPCGHPTSSISAVLPFPQCNAPLLLLVVPTNTDITAQNAAVALNITSRLGEPSSLKAKEKICPNIPIMMNRFLMDSTQ